VAGTRVVAAFCAGGDGLGFGTEAEERPVEWIWWEVRLYEWVWAGLTPVGRAQAKLGVCEV